MHCKVSDFVVAVYGRFTFHWFLWCLMGEQIYNHSECKPSDRSSSLKLSACVIQPYVALGIQQYSLVNWKKEASLLLLSLNINIYLRAFASQTSCQFLLYPVEHGRTMRYIIFLLKISSDVFFGSWSIVGFPFGDPLPSNTAAVKTHITLFCGSQD